MAPPSKERLLTAPNSKLAEADLSRSLRKLDAWFSLDYETQQRLYSLLPPARPNTRHNPHMHPCGTAFWPAIVAEMRAWQEDLREGRETKKWREDAMKAGKDRVDGKFDVLQKEEGGEDSVAK